MTTDMHFQNKTNKNKLHEAGPKKKKLTVNATVQFLFWRQAPPL